MTGIVLIVIALFTLIIAILFRTQSGKKKKADTNIQEIIDMAIADGVLTPNEKELLKELAAKKGLDYQDVLAEVENRISNSKTDTETEIIDYNEKNGYDFEKFIVQKFNRRFFKVKEWRGDKYINGIYAETTPLPDILLEFTLKNKTTQIFVECKWRKQLYRDGVEIARSEQYERYKSFQEKMKIPVFFAIGIGGKGASPEKLYVVPLNETEGNFVDFNKLKNYSKILNSNFFFDSETSELR